MREKESERKRESILQAIRRANEMERKRLMESKEQERRPREGESK